MISRGPGPGSQGMTGHGYRDNFTPWTLALALMRVAEKSNVQRYASLEERTLYED